MVEIINLFKQIQETSGLNDKMSIIAANKDNKLFKKCLKFLLDGNIVTGISTKKIKKKLFQVPNWHHTIYVRIVRLKM